MLWLTTERYCEKRELILTQKEKKLKKNESEQKIFSRRTWWAAAGKESNERLGKRRSKRQRIQD